MMRQLLALVGLVLVGLVVLAAFHTPVTQAAPTTDDGSAIGAGNRRPGSVAVVSVVGAPTISVGRMNSILAAYGSPAAGKGQALYQAGVQHHINPVIALAFFLHESTMGTRGEARVTHSLGNLRCYSGAQCVDQDRGGYAWFPTWEAGFIAWYALIAGPLYIGAGRTTFEQIIPRYAPSADGNSEAVYIAALYQAVNTWQSGGVLV